MDQLTDLLNNMEGGRSLQKKLSKIPSQQIENLLKQYSGGAGMGISGGSEQSQPLTRREQLRQMIRQKEQPRLGRKPNSKDDKKTATVNTPAPRETSAERRHRDKNRIRRLKQKYKSISDEQYFQALEKLTHKERLSVEEIKQYQNQVDLYHHSHRNDLTELKTTDLDQERELDLTSSDSD